jgi:hypothetical protein
LIGSSQVLDLTLQPSKQRTERHLDIQCRSAMLAVPPAPWTSVEIELYPVNENSDGSKHGKHGKVLHWMNIKLYYFNLCLGSPGYLAFDETSHIDPENESSSPDECQGLC